MPVIAPTEQGLAQAKQQLKRDKVVHKRKRAADDDFNPRPKPGKRGRKFMPEPSAPQAYEDDYDEDEDIFTY